ncbi:MAG: excinuclease ABC subunit UvrA [Bacteroidales bacterium]|nr:excinuclease ABC subunit UvrA [Bacteroidales bacterium]
MSVAEDNAIILKGIKVNNLQNIDVLIPRNQLTVVTGVSGSGKSSLVFDTLYAEGQRRYVESLSSYARQFLGKINKPDIEYVKGIPPAIVIEQQTSSKTSRSTVGTTSEIYDYLKLLFGRLGKTYSPVSGRLVKRDSVSNVCDYIFSLDTSHKIMILSPIGKTTDRSLQQILEILKNQGFSRVVQNETIIPIDTLLARTKEEKEKVYLLIDRCSLNKDAENKSRIADSIESAYFHGNGKCEIWVYNAGECIDKVKFSNDYQIDGITFRKPNVNMFNFSNSYGACPACNGLGEVQGISPELVIPNKKLSVYEGAVVCWHGDKMNEFKELLIRNAHKFNFNIHQPIEELTEQQYHDLWYGNEYFPGIEGFFQFVEKNVYKVQYRVLLSRYRGRTLCPECKGHRLAKDAYYVKIENKSIADLVDMPLGELLAWMKELKFHTKYEKKIAELLLKEIITRLTFLCDLGLSYLTLNRAASTLSGGEAQRINLATSLGSNLVGSLYILDEPSIGLHSVDTDKLIKLLKHLRDIGNTVVVVEHDESIMRAADYIIDVGPYSGRLGGKIIYQGKPSRLSTAADSITAQYLDGRRVIKVPDARKKFNHKITVNGANINNLKNVNVSIPLGIFTVITGVSGSGKSSLIKGVLYPNIQRHLELFGTESPSHTDILGGNISAVKAVELVDQNPIGRSSRSNPATYLGIFDHIRHLFAEQPLSKLRAYKAGFFSFNTQGGRCEACQGEGVVKIKMQFMSDVEICCDECGGKGYKEETLEVKVGDKNIYDILQMTVDEANDFFSSLPQTHIVNNIIQGLNTMQQVGLGYMQLGQSVSSLSGGEAQRIKLAYALQNSPHTPNTLFIFDEPTTGLHFFDIDKLYQTFRLLINQGHSIVVIEHNMEMIKCADWIIELGPEGGKKGGEVIFEGTPEDMLKCTASPTARFLREKLS